MTSPLTLFREWAADPKLAVLDTETTGLHGEVVEIAIVNGRGETLLDTRVLPTCDVEPRAAQMHGLTLDILRQVKAPSMAEVWPALREIVSTHRVVIYNAEFDTNVISRSLDAAMPNWYAHPSRRPGVARPVGGRGYSDAYLPAQAFYRSAECVMHAYAPIHGRWHEWYRRLAGLRPACGSWSWAKLVDACAREGVTDEDLPGVHSALGDALRTLRLIQAVARRADDSLPHLCPGCGCHVDDCDCEDGGEA